MDERAHVWSVRELNEAVRELLEGVPSLRRIRVCGEVTNCHENGISGHWYFTLREGTTKRNEYAVRCVMWKWDAARVRYKPKNGERFVVTASVTVYVNGGDYQLRVTDLEPEGVGDKQLAREKLMAELANLGYFDAERKRPLPAYPGRVGVITSATGDAVRDVIATLKGRWPVAKVVVLPVFVQGEKAAPSIAGAIAYANRYRVADVLIVGRGGGSVEDLDVFDDRAIAQAIYASQIPVVTAVGHTKNVTIADLVADRNTITPTQAGQAVSPDVRQVLRELDVVGTRLERAMLDKCALCSRQLEKLAGRPGLSEPALYIRTKAGALNEAAKDLASAAERYTHTRTGSLSALAAKLDALSPLKVLGRGYAIAEKNGAALRSVSDARKGDSINIRLSGGSLDCLVEEVHHG